MQCEAIKSKNKMLLYAGCFFKQNILPVMTFLLEIMVPPQKKSPFDETRAAIL